MREGSQPERPLVVAVAGVAGSGKSTLGHRLAAVLGLPVLDLDSVTNPLLDRLPAVVLGGHWLDSPHAPAVRDGRYAALRAVAQDVVRTARGAVLVAPFTAELTGGDDWHALREALPDAEFHLVHLVGEPGLLARRRAARGAERDRHRPPAVTAVPAVPVVPIDANLTPDQQLRRVLAAIGIPPGWSRTPCSGRSSTPPCSISTGCSSTPCPR